jgi:hypothetical protein
MLAANNNLVALHLHVDLLRTEAWYVHLVAEIAFVVDLQLGRVVAQLEIWEVS